MQELTMNEIEQVNGGSLMYGLGYGGAAGAIAATTFKTAYETATFFGAGRFGSWLGSNLYTMMNK